MRLRNRRKQHLDTKREAPSQVLNTEQIMPQPEVRGEQMAQPFMLHSDSQAKTAELPG